MKNLADLVDLVDLAVLADKCQLPNYGYLQGVGIQTRDSATADRRDTNELL